MSCHCPCINSPNANQDDANAIRDSRAIATPREHTANANQGDERATASRDGTALR